MATTVTLGQLIQDPEVFNQFLSTTNLKSKNNMRDPMRPVVPSFERTVGKELYGLFKALCEVEGACRAKDWSVDNLNRAKHYVAESQAKLDAALSQFAINPGAKLSGIIAETAYRNSETDSDCVEDAVEIQSKDSVSVDLNLSGLQTRNLSFVNGEWVVKEAASTKRKYNKRLHEDVLNAINSSPSPLTTGELRERFGSGVHKVLSMLVETQRIRFVSRGLYARAE